MSKDFDEHYIWWIYLIQRMAYGVMGNSNDISEFYTNFFEMKAHKDQFYLPITQNILGQRAKSQK